MEEKQSFWKTSMGKLAIIVISYVVFIALICGCAEINQYVAAAVALVCVYFGWGALTSIQPAMFIWMPLAGWGIYFFVKFILSYIIGIFVTPYRIGVAIFENVCSL